MEEALNIYFHPRKKTKKNELVDSFGNFSGIPVKIIKKTNAHNFIEIKIYEHLDKFYFAFNFKLAKLVDCEIANVQNNAYGSCFDAAYNAVRAIERLVAVNKKAREIFYTDFHTIANYQRELF
ncbi:MAG: hypothetical protein ACRC4W_04735 [Treponemataceae bacterium]